MGLRRAAGFVVLFLVLATPASAGTYEVSLCSTTGGTETTTDGWGPFFLMGVGSLVDRCAQSGSRRLESTLAPNTTVADGSYVGWSFTAPPTTTIANYTLWRTVSPNHGSNGTGGNFWAHAYLLQEDVRVPPLVSSTSTAEICLEYSSTQCTARGNPSSPYSSANRFSR